MNNFLQKKHKALLKGAIITIVLGIMLNQVGLVIINPTHVILPVYIFINSIGIVSCWLIISFLIHKFSIYKILGIVALLITAIIIESFSNILFNPITISLLVLFWLGVTYLILPEFFKKYQIIILSVYGVILSYFLIFRMRPNYIEEYHQNFLNFMIIPIPVFFALWVYEQWRWMKILKADKAKAELESLKNQINPHFFFNTLNNLYGLVVEKSEKAPEVVLKLSDMMRYTIYEGKEDLVLLKDEINYLESYIELHKIRYQKSVVISFTHDIEDRLKVAPLLFIILLENAFKHGVEKVYENAFINLRMHAIDTKLYFTIENSFDASASNHTHGIGLENLKKRLDYSYPNRHELIIEKKESVYTVHLNIELT